MPPEAICVLRLSAIGDCCHTLPVVRTLQKAYPQTPVTWIIGTTEYSLMEGADGVEFITFDKRLGTRGVLDVRKQLAGRRFSLLLDMHASMRANMVSLAVTAQRRIGFDRARARDYQWLVTNERIAAREHQHVMDGLFGFAEHLGVTERELRWDIPISDEDRHWARAQRPVDRPLVVISPCSSQRANNFRNWSIENYVGLIRYLNETYGARTILTGAKTAIEAEYGEAISAAAPDTVNLVGQTRLKRLFALIEAADLVVCPDSGPAHMATAADTPVIGLYATSNPDRTGPYRSRDLTVNRYPDAVEREFGKPVEALRWGQRVRDPSAMALITVEDVTAKADRALGQP